MVIPVPWSTCHYMPLTEFGKNAEIARSRYLLHQMHSHEQTEAQSVFFHILKEIIGAVKI